MGGGGGKARLGWASTTGRMVRSRKDGDPVWWLAGEVARYLYR